MDRLLNYVFTFILIFLFVLASDAMHRVHILVAFSAAALFSFLVFLFNGLSLDGGESATVVGAVAYGLGGIDGALLMLLFFLSSALISKSEDLDRLAVRRDGKQVWANGFWFALYLCLWYIWSVPVFWIAAVGSLSVAAADTWATELGGHRFPGPTILINNGQRVEPGTDGGISFIGTLATLAGSALMGLAATYLTGSFRAPIFAAVAGAGVIGSLADSWFGAVLQRQRRSFRLRWLSRSRYTMKNNGVNWLATGVGTITAIIINQII